MSMKQEIKPIVVEEYIRDQVTFAQWLAANAFNDRIRLHLFKGAVTELLPFSKPAQHKELSSSLEFPPQLVALIQHLNADYFAQPNEQLRFFSKNDEVWLPQKLEGNSVEGVRKLLLVTLRRLLKAKTVSLKQYELIKKVVLNFKVDHPGGVLELKIHEGLSLKCKFEVNGETLLVHLGIKKNNAFLNSIDPQHINKLLMRHDPDALRQEFELRSLDKKELNTLLWLLRRQQQFNFYQISDSQLLIDEKMGRYSLQVSMISANEFTVTFAQQHSFFQERVVTVASQKERCRNVLRDEIWNATEEMPFLFDNEDLIDDTMEKFPMLTEEMVRRILRELRDQLGIEKEWKDCDKQPGRSATEGSLRPDLGQWSFIYTTTWDRETSQHVLDMIGVWRQQNS